jgi:hypothetical protein
MMSLIDWQLITSGGAVYDVSYLLGQSMDRATRREHEIDLLHLWHDTPRRTCPAIRTTRRGRLPALGSRTRDPDSGRYDHGNERGLQLVQMLTTRSVPRWSSTSPSCRRHDGRERQHLLAGTHGDRRTAVPRRTATPVVLRTADGRVRCRACDSEYEAEGAVVERSSLE